VTAVNTILSWSTPRMAVFGLLLIGIILAICIVLGMLAKLMPADPLRMFRAVMFGLVDELKGQKGVAGLINGLTVLGLLFILVLSLVVCARMVPWILLTLVLVFYFSYGTLVWSEHGQKAWAVSASAASQRSEQEATGPPNTPPTSG